MKIIPVFFLVVNLLFFTACGSPKQADEIAPEECMQTEEVIPAGLAGEMIASFYFYYPSGDYPDNDFYIERAGAGAILTKDKIWNDEGNLGFDSWNVDGKALQDLQDIVVEYNILSWDGFDKFNTKGSSANERFFLKIVYEDGRVVRAQGDHVFPDGYKAAEAALLAFFEGLVSEKRAEEQALSKKSQLENVSGIDRLSFRYGNSRDKSNPTYSIKSTDDGLVLSLEPNFTTIVFDVDPVVLNKRDEMKIISIYKKHGVYSLDGFDEQIIDGNPEGKEVILLNDIYYDNDGDTFHFSVLGYGVKPDGFDAFAEEIVAYFNKLLKIEKGSEIPHSIVQLKDVSSISAMKIEYGYKENNKSSNFLICQYSLDIVEEDLLLSHTIKLVNGETAKMTTEQTASTVLKKENVDRIISIFNKHGAFSWNGFDVEIEPSRDRSAEYVSVYIFGLFPNAEGGDDTMYVNGNGPGAMPEGYDSFFTEIDRYFKSLLYG